jgi:hypothetical protein
MGADIGQGSGALASAAGEVLTENWENWGEHPFDWTSENIAQRMIAMRRVDQSATVTEVAQAVEEWRGDR